MLLLPSEALFSCVLSSELTPPPVNGQLRVDSLLLLNRCHSTPKQTPVVSANRSFRGQLIFLLVCRGACPLTASLRVAMEDRKSVNSVNAVVRHIRLYP